MARTKDRNLAEMKKIREKLSARLMRAHRRGRLDAEMQDLHREAQHVLREAKARARSARPRKQA